MTILASASDKVILVVDDDPEHNAAIAWRLCHEGFAVETATSGKACLGALAVRQFDAVLLDINLGDSSGLEVLESVRRTHGPGELPVIVVTGEAYSEMTVRALKGGANDFVPKPVDLEVAVARLRNQLHLRSATQELQVRALYDQLTGLPNRALLVDRMTIAVARAMRTQLPFAILLMDFDGFKSVNDRHGHPVGDRLLCEIAGRLSENTRKLDTVGRLGGDEFVVISESIPNQPELDFIVARLEQVLSEPFEIEGHSISVGVSIGSYLWQNDDVQDFESLVGIADAEMYKIKRARKAS